MIPNTIAISIIMGTLATTSVTNNLTNSSDDYYHVFDSNQPKVERLPHFGVFEDHYHGNHSLAEMLETFENYCSLDIESRKNDLRQLFEDRLSFGDVKKAREVLSIAVKEFPMKRGLVWQIVLLLPQNLLVQINLNQKARVRR